MARDVSAAWFPWLEVNQGFLSVLAIVLALGLAFAEWLNAKSEGVERIRAPVQIAVDLVQKLIADVEVRVGEIENGAMRPERAYDLKINGYVTTRALDAILSANPPTAAFAIALISARDVTDFKPHLTNSSSEAIDSLRGWLKRLSPVLEDLRQNLPGTKAIAQ
jgi:hypothetical protein